MKGFCQHTDLQENALGWQFYLSEIKENPNFE